MAELTTLAELHWEYHNFTYPLSEGTCTWVTLSDDGRYTEPLARGFFWQRFESEIADELESWQNDGWEPIKPTSPHGLQLRCQEYFDKKITLLDIMIWIATLGMVLLTTIFLGFPPRRYITYEALEFCTLLRRPIAPSASTA